MQHWLNLYGMLSSTLTDYYHFFPFTQAPLDVKKACKEKKGKTQ